MTDQKSAGLPVEGDVLMGGATKAWDPFLEPPYPEWKPYCLMCSTMDRMVPTSYGWRCWPCGNPIGKDGKHWHGSIL